MHMLFSWLIKSVIISSILYVYYHVTLRNKHFHLYNRFYLLGAVMLSLLCPFIRLFEIEAPRNNPVSLLLNIVNAPFRVLETGPHFFTDNTILSFSVAVSIILLMLLLSKIIWVFTVKADGKQIKRQGINFIETAVKQAPFSFFNNLFWKKGMLTTDPGSEKIFKHELAHIKQGHTSDKLFCQFISCIFWMNPFYWLIQKELNVIHEFLADEKCIEHGDGESFARMLLYSYDSGSYLSPAHSFFNSSVKRRLMMVTSSQNSQYSYLRKLLVLPYGLLVLTVFTITVKAQKDPNLHLGSELALRIQNHLLEQQHAEKLAAEKAALK